MKNFLLLISILLLFQLNLFSQTTILSLIDFEAAGGYTISPAEFSDGAYDYVTNTSILNIGGDVEYINIQGNSFFGAQDTNGAGESDPFVMLINDINIDNYENLIFSIYVAEDDSTDGNEDWDATTSFLVEYQLGSGSFQNLYAIEARGIMTGSNVEPAVDTDFDGVGDGTTITDVFFQYSRSIANPGSETILNLRISFTKLNDGDEDIAIDDIKVTGELIPTPVTLTSFEAKLFETKSINLTWQTASEENNDYFSIEHSTDGNSFREIATQVGNGTTSLVQNYSFLHKDVENGLHYYRLKQVDFDGKYEYTNIVTAKVSHSNGDIFLTPNPTSNVILIQTKTPFERDADFQILNMQGQVVLSSVLQEGVTDLELNIADFPVGIYYLQLFVDNDVMMKKIIKQ